MTAIGDAMQSPILSIIVFLPVLGAIILLLVKPARLSGKIASLFVLISFLLSLIPVFQFQSGQSGYQFEHRLDWISGQGIQFHLGLDGLSIWLFELTFVIGLLCVLYSAFVYKSSSKPFYASFLVLITAFSGLFAAIDLFLFLIFLGLSLAPPFIILNLSNRQRKQVIGLKSFLFHLTSFFLLTIGFLKFYVENSHVTGVSSFNWVDISQISMPVETQQWLFWLLFAGFGILMPLFPFHSWLANVVSESPASLSVFSMAVGIKAGIYGMLRFAIPGCPDAAIQFAPILVYIALINVIYGGLVALAQPDMKKLLGFSCLSHAGFLLLGAALMNYAGIMGSMMHMVNHGLVFAALFFPVAWLHQKYGSSLIMDYGGLRYIHPVLVGLMLVAALAYFGMPGLSCFPGFFLILEAAVRIQVVWSLVAMAGMILTAAYLISFIQRVCFNPGSTVLRDDTPRTGRILPGMLVVMVIIMVWIGIMPQTLMSRSDRSVREINSIIRSHRMLQRPEIQKIEPAGSLEKFLSTHSDRIPYPGDK